MELFEAIGKRHSYRGPFTDAPSARKRERSSGGHQGPSGRTTDHLVRHPGDRSRPPQAAGNHSRPACQTACDDRLRHRSAADLHGHSPPKTARGRRLSWRSPRWATPVWLDGVLRLMASPSDSPPCSACPAARSSASSCRWSPAEALPRGKGPFEAGVDAATAGGGNRSGSSTEHRFQAFNPEHEVKTAYCKRHWIDQTMAARQVPKLQPGNQDKRTASRRSSATSEAGV